MLVCYTQKYSLYRLKNEDSIQSGNYTQQNPMDTIAIAIAMENTKYGDSPLLQCIQVEISTLIRIPELP